MSYAPTTNNDSGQILAQGINAGANNITAALDGIMKKRQEATSAIAAMDMLASLNPEALPRDPTGAVDVKFLEKFYGAPLAAQQQTLGLITSKLLMTPEDKARIGATNAQAGLINAQTEQYKQAAQSAAAGAQAYAGHRKALDKWSGYAKPSTGNAAPFAGPELPTDPVNDLPPLPDVLPPLN
jgi:hypothetical protein